MEISDLEKMNEIHQRFCKTSIEIVTYLIKSHMPNIMIKNKKDYTDNCSRNCSNEKRLDCIVTKYFADSAASSV
jgi:hypothetical protein